jgi:hypothetical protein
MAAAVHDSDDALPEDWEFQIARAYGVLAPDEFGIWGKLDFDFLSEKAKKQLRDVKGQFRDMRGRLRPGPPERTAPPHRGAQGVTNLFRGPSRPVHNQWVERSHIGPEAERPTIPAADVAARRDDPVQRLGGKDAEKALVRAGIPKEAAKYYARRGQVFTRDGATFAWAPSRDEAEVLRRERQARERLNAAQRRLDALESDQARSREKDEEVRAMRRVVDDLAQGHDEVRDQAGRLGSPEASEADAATAEAVLKTLEWGLQEVPPWRTETPDGKRRPFMAVVSADMLVNGESSGETVPGGYYMVVDPHTSDEDLKHDQEAGWSMAVDAESSLEYTVIHELGHLLDTSDHSDPMSTRHPGNRDLWEASIAVGDMSKYGSSIPEEGYAEAWAGLQMNEEEVPMASLMYGLWYGWFDDQRGSAPSPPPQMESLVRQLAEKSRLHEQQRSTQSAAARRQAKQQLVDWLTQWSEENAG